MGGVFVTTGTTCEAPLEEQQQLIFKGQAELEEGSFHQKSMADDFDRVKVLVAQSCLTLCDPMVCSPPGFSVHGILQARKLEWVALPFSRGSS